MEGPSYMPNNPNFPEMWRMKQYGYAGLWDGGASTRSPVDVNINATIPLTPTGMHPTSDGEWFSFSSCAPYQYKEYAMVKGDKPSSHDVSDTMLSLKHAVVHPSMCPLMSPVSPSLPPHFSQSLTSPQPSCPSFTYTVGHAQPQFVANTFSPGAFTAQYGEQGGPGQGQGLFPSMSVNVSMSMNLGMPTGLNHGQYPPQLTPQPWSTQPNSPPYHHSYSPLPNQYPSYSSQPYPTAYSLSSEFRTKADVRMCKDRFCPDESRFAAKAGFCGFARAKMMQYRSVSPGIDDPSKINLCQICGKSYARPSTLKTHMRTHSGEKPYRCGTCHKSFSQAANLTAHMRTHSGEKPFRCPICDRRFSQSSSVTTHMRTHSGERPYRCQMCKKAFSDSSTLTKHLRIHSGEKPYQCKLCLLRFSQSGNLNRHMRVHANNST